LTWFFIYAILNIVQVSPALIGA